MDPGAHVSGKPVHDNKFMSQARRTMANRSCKLPWGPVYFSLLGGGCPLSLCCLAPRGDIPPGGGGKKGGLADSDVGAGSRSSCRAPGLQLELGAAGNARSGWQPQAERCGAAFTLTSGFASACPGHSTAARAVSPATAIYPRSRLRWFSRLPVSGPPGAPGGLTRSR